MNKFLEINSVFMAVFGLSIFGALKLFYGRLMNSLKEEAREKEDRHEALQKKLEIQDAALLAMLHHRLYKLCIAYLDDGGVSVEELNDLEHLFVPYELLGGNGTVKALVLRVRDLPIKQNGGD